MRSLVLIILIGLIAQQIPAVVQWEDQIADLFDKRPAVRVLFIGNSRTAQFEWPYMVRKIADSAHSTYKYQITMDAPSGISLQDHWNSAHTQDLLHEKWNYVSLQGRSSEQVTPEWEASFQEYGVKLSQRARSNGATVLLFVGWRYADYSAVYKDNPGLKDTWHTMIQDGYYNLSRATGGQMVNVGRIWEQIRLTNPQIRLFQDDNHQSVNGAYLCALMFYRALSHDDLRHVTYVPEGVDPKVAEVLKTAAQSW